MNTVSLNRVVFGLLCVVAIFSTPSIAQSERDLVKEFTKADVVAEGEMIDAINVATKSLRSTPDVRGVGRLLSSYFVATMVSDSTITVWFVPRTVEGKSLRLNGAVETKVTLHRKSLKVLNKELFL